MSNTLDEILESFGEDVADQYGDGLVGLDTAKQQIQALITEAYDKGYYNGRYDLANSLIPTLEVELKENK